MGWAPGPWGVGELWAVSTQSKGSDYYLARYNFTTNQWNVLTSHWGLRCAVSELGKCYHVNAAGQIWWATSTGSSNSINTPVIHNQSTKVIDIDVANYDGTLDFIRIICQTPSGNKYICNTLYMDDGNSTNWTVEGKYGIVGSPVRISIDMTNFSQGAACDSYGYLYVHGDPEWMRFIGTSNFTDVATCGGNTAAIKSSKLYIYQESTGLFVNTGITAKKVITTIMNDMPSVLFINSSNKLEEWPFRAFQN
jgi:hypothetical protein